MFLQGAKWDFKASVARFVHVIFVTGCKMSIKDRSNMEQKRKKICQIIFTLFRFIEIDLFHCLVKFAKTSPQVC